MKECYLISRIYWTRDEHDGTVTCVELHICCQLTIYFLPYSNDRLTTCTGSFSKPGTKWPTKIWRFENLYWVICNSDVLYNLAASFIVLPIKKLLRMRQIVRAKMSKKQVPEKVIKKLKIRIYDRQCRKVLIFLFIVNHSHLIFNLNKIAFNLIYLFKKMKIHFITTQK